MTTCPTPRHPKRAVHLAAVALAAAALTGVAGPAVAADDGPPAELRVTDLNHLTERTIFSAMTSGVNGDHRGLTFAFDVDGDGVYAAPTPKAFAEHVFTVPGDYVASVRVTDELGRSTVASAPFEVTAVKPAAIAEVEEDGLRMLPGLALLALVLAVSTAIFGDSRRRKL